MCFPAKFTVSNSDSHQIFLQQAAAEAAEKRAQDQWPAWFRFGGLGSVVDAEKMEILWFGDLAEGKYPPLEKQLRNG